MTYLTPILVERPASAVPELTGPELEGAQAVGCVDGRTGSQTLERAFDIVQIVAARPGVRLHALAEAVGLTKSTTHRLAAALVRREYLSVRAGEGYRLGPELLQLGFLAQQQRDLVRTARPHIVALAEATQDTVHLAVQDEGTVLYLDKISGSRRVHIRTHIGEREPLTSTGLGKALLFDVESRWAELYDKDGPRRSKGNLPKQRWLAQMADYSLRGYAFDLEENEDRIRCVAAPLRDETGAIVAALSVASAAQYMSEDRMVELARTVVSAASAISRDLGCR